MNENSIGVADPYARCPEIKDNGKIMSANEIVWEDKVRSLTEIVKNGTLPCVVKVKKGDIKKYMPENGTTKKQTVSNSTDDILHVLAMRRHKMVVVCKLQWNGRIGKHVKTDKQTEIDVTLKGWFEVLTDNGQPVEYFDTINAIVSMQPKQFLVRTSITAHQRNMENEAITWVPLEIRHGEVLTTGTVYSDWKKTKKKTLFKRIFSSGKGIEKKDHLLKYLQCFDSENREIMVPLSMSGVFSPVGDPSIPNYDAVYTLIDLINAFDLPTKAQMIDNDFPGHDGILSGVVLLERLTDKETILVGEHPCIEGQSETFEIPLSEEFCVVQEKKIITKRTSLLNLEDSVVDYTQEKVDDVGAKNQIHLPIRVKDGSKKSKSNAILDKLSVRSKTRKERANLKALREKGVFSSKLSKTAQTFDSLIDCQVDDVEQMTNETVNSTCNNNGQRENNTDKAKDKVEYGYSVDKRVHLRARDLPPIPIKANSPISQRQHCHNENEYEELPSAPRPPTFFLEKQTDGDHHDGYMTPANFRGLNENIPREAYGVMVKRKPPTAPKDSVRQNRSRRARSEYYSPEYQDSDPGKGMDRNSIYTAEEENGIPVTTHSEGNYDRRTGLPADEQHYAINTRSKEDIMQFHDDSFINFLPMSSFTKLKSRSQKNLKNIETNATIRSHNVRKVGTAMDVFNFSDSLKDLRQPLPNGHNESSVGPMYGRLVDNERIKSYIFDDHSSYGQLGQQPYVASEPGCRRYQRSSLNAALSDPFPKHGDDSAISLCSRGEYGTFHGESDYSYSEYSEWHDDSWVPPSDISGLSVLEVSKSLRFIGMKDRVVIRFAREQIDGNMLSSLDTKLLKEGFPELNALDIKKILDFVDGWRPKK